MSAFATVGAAYAVFLLLLGYAKVTDARRDDNPIPVATRDLALTVAGGYLTFLAILLAFSPLAGVPLAPTLRAAAAQGAMLTAVAVAFYTIAAAGRASRRRT